MFVWMELHLKNIGTLLFLLMACSASKHSEHSDTDHDKGAGSESSEITSEFETGSDNTETPFNPFELPSNGPNPLPENALVDPNLWLQATEAVDPFLQYRTENSICLANSYGPVAWGQDTIFDVDTGTCNYITVVQSTLLAVPAGETIYIWAWYLELTSPEPVTAMMAISIDEEVIFSLT